MENMIKQFNQCAFKVDTYMKIFDYVICLVGTSIRFGLDSGNCIHRRFMTLTVVHLFTGYDLKFKIGKFYLDKIFI